MTFDRASSYHTWYMGASAVAVDRWDRIVVAGTSTYNSSGDSDFAVARLGWYGALDPTFSYDGKQTIAFDLGGLKTDEATAMALDSQGRIVVAGTVDRGNGDTDFGVTRLTDSGQLDYSFGNSGKSVASFDVYAGGPTADVANALAIDASDRIVVAGGTKIYGNGAYAVTRLNVNGYYDPTFGYSGRTIVHYDRDGHVHDAAYGVTIDRQGRIVLAGSSSMPGSPPNSTVARLTPDGWHDSSFGMFGWSWFDADQRMGWSGGDMAKGVALDAQGRLVVVGGVQRGAQGLDWDFYVARIGNE